MLYPLKREYLAYLACIFRVIIRIITLVLSGKVFFKDPFLLVMKHTVSFSNDANLPSVKKYG